LAEEFGTASRAVSILEDIGFLKRTIEAMEQFTKPLPVQRHPEDLQQMIQQAIEKAREGVIQQRHDPSAVEVVIAAAPAIRLRVSRRLIVFALTNVIQNAIECFADREVDSLRAGRIDVQVVVDGYETRILVIDDGPGNEPEVLKELTSFAPTGPNKAKRNSSGWGLSLVHKYVTAHGGLVIINSEMNQGTTVVVTLPMRDSAGRDDE
ncbi:MAG: HAMP domain-containing histidine kinase, partial [Phycisphaerae bacterium]|nr:HAMP domain-containing histidine kinase [Phycisphaerae bacterium]